MFDPSPLRRQFPIFAHPIGKSPLVYLDSAATAQKPQTVLDAMRTFYETQNGNAHRGMHVLAERSTLAYENARVTVQTFLNAASPTEIVFTKNATEAINLVARAWGRARGQSDRVALTVLEHHSNIVPWMQRKEELGTAIDWTDVDETGRVRMDELETVLSAGRTTLLAITGLSNVLGTLTELTKAIRLAHDAGALVLVDASQLVAHAPVDVMDLDCDFLAFSGHKLFGPLGIGVLYGKKDLLEAMPPFLGGGTMIQSVTTDGFVPADVPQRFEAGTQPVAEAVGLATAIDWFSALDPVEIRAHESMLLANAVAGLRDLPGVTVLGPADDSIAGCVSFVTDGVHPHDLTEIVGRNGVCLRAGHHCAEPLHHRLGIPASTRLSVAPYNTEEDIAIAIKEIAAALKKLRG